MASLVDHLLSRVDSPRLPSARYDERLGYTVDSSGAPLVESKESESNETGEEDSGRDGPDEPLPNPDDESQIEVLRTFVEREDDELPRWEAVAMMTQTATFVRTEQPDHDE